MAFIAVAMVLVLGCTVLTRSSHHARPPTGHPSGSFTAAGDPASSSVLAAGPAARASLAAISPSAPLAPAALTAVEACADNPAGQKELLVRISTQTLWACSGPQMINTSPVTTGASFSTPTGTFHIQAVEGPQYLTGCNAATGCWHDYVHEWMPFDGPYGFHDAPWQTMPFGSADFVSQGSHGCVHLPQAESIWVHGWVAVGTTVTILD